MTMMSLVDRLCSGEQRLEVRLRPEASASALHKRIELGHVHLLFPDTRGGTEVGVTLDPAAVELGDADFVAGTGRLTLVGHFTLDFVPLRCTAIIDLASLSGAGHLERCEH
jgi:hypothetical protein